jgi:steroid delta-isomerase-like uncharacterized protein
MVQASIIDIAKAPIVGYNEKNWDAVRAAVAPGFVYDEVATNRKPNGIEDVLTVWRAWAAAIPDSKASFHTASASGNTVVLEVTWHGTHTGTLQTAKGEIAPTGRKIALRACQVVEVQNAKATVMRQYFDMATLLQQLGVGS